MQVALVQGASRGLGLAFVQLLLESDPDLHVIATARHVAQSEALCALRAEVGERLKLLSLDLRDEASLHAASEALMGTQIDLLINCAGLLHEGRLMPEKALEQVELAHLQQVFAVNAFGPLLVAKHFLPHLRREGRVILANVSARVGSIGDNRLGGWYAYRASKAAQNMLTKTLAIELTRRLPNVLCVALHPGTVETELSRPFCSRVPKDKLFEPRFAAAQLLGVLERLEPHHHGSFLAWDGQEIPW